jgi:outer membrane protein assembly factor BamE (lipoprotein component of BamABCDE complex)
MRLVSTTLSGVTTVLLLVAAAGPVVGAEKGRAPTDEREFTLGLVQKELKVGMSQTEVVSALGSPNLVTRNGQSREAWVYDKVASEARVRSTGVGGGAGGIGSPGASLILGFLGGHVRNDKAVTMQKTLTVVVRFNADGTVESFSFHASRF